LYTREFADDPHATYDELRKHGPAAPVFLAPDVPATLVTGYDAALQVMQDPATFRKDPRIWQSTVPTDSPILAVTSWRENALFTDGREHARLRGAVASSLGRVDLTALRGHVTHIADTLIDGFAADGRADLLHDYAKPLSLRVFTRLFGCPDDLGERLMIDTQAIFDGVEPEQANARLDATLQELILLKRAQPGHDVVTWLMQHPAQLRDNELRANLLVMMGAGSEPEAHFIANALHQWMTDAVFADDLASGTVLVEDALDDVLWRNPPIANYCLTYPTHDVDRFGMTLFANQPVGLSLAAANTDPSLPTGQRAGNRAHLAFAPASPHACPAQRMARLVAYVAVERLLDRLPDLHADPDAGPVRWRASPFMRGLEALPVRFPRQHVSAQPAATPGGPSCSPVQPNAPTFSTPAALTSTERPGPSARTGRPRWWSFLAGWSRGR
jgi:cytochrome P450